MQRTREIQTDVRIRRWAGEAVRGMTEVQPDALEGGMACLRGVSRDNSSEPPLFCWEGPHYLEACFYCTILGPRK